MELLLLFAPQHPAGGSGNTSEPICRRKTYRKGFYYPFRMLGTDGSEVRKTLHTLVSRSSSLETVNFGQLKVSTWLRLIKVLDNNHVSILWVSHQLRENLGIVSCARKYTKRSRGCNCGLYYPQCGLVHAGGAVSVTSWSDTNMKSF